MIVIEESRIARWLLPKNYVAINLFGIILTKEKELNRIQLAHEHIHTCQYREVFNVVFVLLGILSLARITPLWTPFAVSPLAYYALYVVEFAVRFVWYAIRERSLRVWQTAYYNVSHEREAYQHQWDESFRKPFGWMWWITKWRV